MASRIIYKYSIPVRDEFELELPYGANIVLFATQEPDLRQPKLWVEHSATGNDKMVVRKFRLYGTGHRIDDPERVAHVGSVICEPFVWHLFEVIV